MSSCKQRLQSSAAIGVCMSSPPPRRSMPSGLLAAGGHDINWRSLRCPYTASYTPPCDHCMSNADKAKNLVGSSTDTTYLLPCRSSELYNPTQDTWTTAPPLPDSISFAAYASAQVQCSASSGRTAKTWLCISCTCTRGAYILVYPASILAQNSVCFVQDLDHRDICAGECVCGEWLATSVLCAAV